MLDTCPNCGMGFTDREFCLECGVKISLLPETVDSRPDRALRTHAVYKAPDELSAITLQRVLESEGIQAWIQSGQIPHDGIMKMVEGYWGKVIVFEDQEAKARNTIEGFLKTLGPGLH